MEKPREWTIEAHSCRFEPPDLLLLEFRGRVSLEVVTDVTGVPKLDAETQHYLGEHADPAWLRALVVVGASLFHRAAARASSSRPG